MNGARSRHRLASCRASSSNLNDPAHVVQAADDGRVHALVFDKVTHRVISGHGQTVLLAVEAVHQVEEDLGSEVGQLELVDVVLKQVVRGPP